LPNIKINKPSNKLNFRKLKLFKILKKISEVSYKLNLPNNIKLKTAVFYISLLKKALVDKEIGEIIINKIII
jgi:transcription initiation factor TFIIIB Brf1 subunit/transcription initiation factor TFIIB